MQRYLNDHSRSNVVVFPRAKRAPAEHDDHPQDIPSSDVQATVARNLLPRPLKMTNGEVVTDTGAVAAIASPWWLPALHDVSQFAAEWLPILGAVWLVVQIGVKVHTAYWKK